MTQYTTGELAKLCGVTVRTVQYYDSRGILVPASLSEGGRRLYTDDDLRKLKIICFLRELGLPLDSISKLLKEEKPENVIELLLDKQESALRDELAEKKEKLDKLTELKKGLRKIENPDHEDIADVAFIMENKKKLARMRAKVIAIGLIADIIEWGTVLLWIFKGIWWPFAAGMPVAVAICVWISSFYYGSVMYICPECHAVFKPKFKEAFWARHTPDARRLTCTCCGHFGYCVETYGKEEKNNA